MYSFLKSEILIYKGTVYRNLLETLEVKNLKKLEDDIIRASMDATQIGVKMQVSECVESICLTK